MNRRDLLALIPAPLLACFPFLRPTKTAAAEAIEAAINEPLTLNEFDGQEYAIVRFDGEKVKNLEALLGGMEWKPGNQSFLCSRQREVWVELRDAFLIGNIVYHGVMLLTEFDVKMASRRFCDFSPTEKSSRIEYRNNFDLKYPLEG